MRMLAAFALTISLIGSGTAAVTAENVEPDYVRTAYDGTIWRVSDEDVIPLTYDEWRDAGFPAWVPAQSTYVKVMTFPTVYAVTVFDRPDVELEVALSWEQFLSAGLPNVETLPWDDSVTAFQWSTSAEIFAADSNGAIVKLTWDQWKSAGYPAFQRREGRGFVRLDWDSSGAIAYMCDTAAGRGGRITFDQWIALGSPSPQVMSRTPNDFVYKVANVASPTIWYLGPVTRNYQNGGVPPSSSPFALSLAQWRAMGSPSPVVTNLLDAERITCGAGAPSPFD